MNSFQLYMYISVLIVVFFDKTNEQNKVLELKQRSNCENGKSLIIDTNFL